MSSSWVYLFSKFTPEALLFESLIIFVLCGAYAAYWVLRKRRYGAVDEMVPSPVVKGYLNQLVNDAYQLRSQLFGLLADAGVSFVTSPARISVANISASTAVPTVTPQQVAQAGTVIASDPELQQRLQELEAQLAAQSQALETITIEKTKILKELELAKKATGGAGGGANPLEIEDLKKKIEELEGKLAEYSVIEDDLANLKRLQQENAELKKSIQSGGGTVPQPQTETLAPTETEAAADPAPESAAAEVPAEVPAETSTETSAEATAGEEEAPAVAAADTSETPNFEGLVDQVEESLQTSDAPAEAPAEAAPEALAETSAEQPAAEADSTPEAAPETAAAPEEAGGGGDDDLLNEFEKMLNS